MNSNNLTIPTDALMALKSGTLFYPSSGSDIDVPIQIFSPWISDFFFIDIRRWSGLALAGQPVFTLIGNQTHTPSGRTIRRHEPFIIDVRKETYIRGTENKSICIHRCKGRGYDAFRTFFKDVNRPLSIFFYRGDSHGDGGSGFYWLHRSRLLNILQVLEEGGLIVTDGSNCSIDQLARFHHSDRGYMAVSEAESFIFSGKRFDCIGYVGERYGPTLIWRVTTIEPVIAVHPGTR